MLPEVLQVVATSYMIGVIWFVQLVHYPGFAHVGADGFSDYAARHVKRTFWVVGPTMLLEAGLALFIVFTRPSFAGLLGAGLLLVAWLSTALLSVPAHNKLQGAWDAATGRRLVNTNWIRTAAWSARGLTSVLCLLEAA